MILYQFGNGVTVHKFQVNYDKKSIINEIDYNVLFNPNTTDTNTEFGIDSNIIIEGFEINKINNNVLNILRDWDYLKENDSYQQLKWAYILNKDKKYTFYHKHEPYKWSWVFYVQVPNNLYEDEGKISFKSELEIFNYLPSEGDLLIFPCSLEHKPIPSTKMDISRITLAGAIKKINTNIKKNFDIKLF